jgi:fructokinase
MKKKVVAIGEILWDVFPDGKKAGGSSMNVALHLQKQQINSELISAVGDDELGKELLHFLHQHQFPTQLIQLNSLPTSTVQVTLDELQQASYTIVAPVAWDYIDLTAQAITAVKNADALVYCSLTCRNAETRRTVLELLNLAKLKVFDINLRPPFYTLETLKPLLMAADILKVNEHELSFLVNELKLTGTSDEEYLKALSAYFTIDTICLTLGDKGAIALQNGMIYQNRGYPTVVADTVGAGDSFLATFLASHLNGYPMDEALARACKIGAYVASKKGANPLYDDEILNYLGK